MKKIVMMALCAFVQAAGLSLVPQQAMATAPIYPTHLNNHPILNGATFHTANNGDIMWIDGKDLSSLPFEIELVKITKANVHLLDTLMTGSFYTRFLTRNLRRQFELIKRAIKDGDAGGYYIRRREDGATVGLIYLEDGAKVLVLPQYSGKHYATHAYITYTHGMRYTPDGEISAYNIPSWRAIASAIDRGGLVCEINNNGTWRQISSNEIRNLTNEIKTGIRKISSKTIRNILIQQFLTDFHNLTGKNESIEEFCKQEENLVSQIENTIGGQWQPMLTLRLLATEW